MSPSRVGDGRVGIRGNTLKRQSYTKGVHTARAGRGRRGGAPGPRRQRFTTSSDNKVSYVDTVRQYTLQTAGRVAGTSRPLLNRNTHTVDEQRCIVRVECGPSYRFAYLLLPLQHVRHRDVFGEVHLAVEHHALAEDRRDVHGILVVLVAGYCYVILLLSTGWILMD
jgi:hypothetical protein